MPEAYICIHGHFYQPPRENAWLETVEQQDSAYPYHDWNERIAAECYGPNTASRLLNEQGQISGIMNNYSHISFDFGPTLLRWMEERQPDIYRTIIEADAESAERFSGHGSALAQAYNHVIMPLASSRDKKTQVVWGIADFRRRFGRQPEGMWLPETAVDLESLELFAEHGIRFTLLAPRQALRCRPLRGGAWQEVLDGKGLDPGRSYLCRLPSGRSIAVFFFDGSISQELAFGDLLDQGQQLAERLLAAAVEGGNNQLISTACDGETFGHHRRFGDMALSYCLKRLEAEKRARLTVYGEYLEKFPPSYEVEIRQETSWSCPHGIERWRSNCGCRSGRLSGWQQNWRHPLRRALDWLREQLAEIFEQETALLLGNAWSARDAYIQVVLDRSAENVDRFLAEHCRREPSIPERAKALSLLEMQRHAMLMYTSCGWFFDEVSGIETTQILQYACRAIQLGEQYSIRRLEDQFKELLSQAPSNVGEQENGASVYERYVQPAEVDLLRAAAHYAISSALVEHPERKIYAFEFEELEHDILLSGPYSLVLGRLVVRSVLTCDRRDAAYAILNLGGSDITGGVRDFWALQTDMSGLKEAFLSGDVPATVRSFDQYFNGSIYLLRHLFRDPQREILTRLLQEAETRVEDLYSGVYRDYFSLVQSMEGYQGLLPEVLRATAHFVLNRRLRRALEAAQADAGELQALKMELKRWGVSIDYSGLAFLAARQIDGIVNGLARAPFDTALLEELELRLRLYNDLKVPLDLWHSQNLIYQIGEQQYFIRRKMAERGEHYAGEWVERFKKVAELMKIEVP